MKKVEIEKDLRIFYVTATSYPNGISDAIQKLHSLIPFSVNRRYINISRPEENSKIVYRAGATEIEVGDLNKLDLQELIVKKGVYYCIEVDDFRADIAAIGRAFEKLLSQTNIDPQGYCVEWYSNNKEMVKCMVKIND
ncbi:hypothetical protein [Pedobacter arcticus]|uniref:hypothetical protein n=1 Tax=Pedobacter arcticus TaxID=752140 RepID=UPI0003049EB0|nr:hypothetical protein [Pedobacter arcticus]